MKKEKFKASRTFKINHKKDLAERQPIEPKEWILQEYTKKKGWVDISPGTELMTQSEMLIKIKEIDNSSQREFRGHNVINSDAYKSI